MRKKKTTEASKVKPDGKKATLKKQKKQKSQRKKTSASSEKFSDLSVARKPSVKSKTKSSRKSQTPAKPSPRQKAGRPVEPQTMEELLAQTGVQLIGLKKGQKVEGIITEVYKRTILIDIGSKTEGLVIDKEFEQVEDFVSNLKAGDKVTAHIVSPENEKCQILLSIKKAAFDYQWDLFEQCLKTGEVIEVRGLEVNRGGLIARLKGTRGFVPASQLSSRYLGNLHQLQNRLFKAKIIEVNRAKNRLIFSEKLVSEAAVLVQRQKALKKVKPGDVLEGVVSGVMPFGIFVRAAVDKKNQPKAGRPLDEKDKSDSVKALMDKRELYLEGLVHISEISWEKVDDLGKLFMMGNRTKVKILGIDEASGKLNLSIKQLTDDPWQKIADKYSVDKKIKGKVARLVAFGAFVELEPGVEGLIHISKIPADYDIKVGKKAEVYVESIDPGKRRMSLGLVLKEKPVGYK